MFIFMYLGVFFIVYIVSFKNDINKEYMDKAFPFITIVSFMFILLGIIGSMGK